MVEFGGVGMVGDLEASPIISLAPVNHGYYGSTIVTLQRKDPSPSHVM